MAVRNFKRRCGHSVTNSSSRFAGRSAWSARSTSSGRKGSFRMLELASRMLDTPVDQLDCGNNEVFTTCACRKSVKMSDLAMQAMYKEKFQIMDGASHFNTDSPPPFCATFAEVEVDTETGQVRVLHLATAVDPGTAINPMQR